MILCATIAFSAGILFSKKSRPPSPEPVSAETPAPDPEAVPEEQSPYPEPVQDSPAADDAVIPEAERRTWGFSVQ